MTLRRSQRHRKPSTYEVGDVLKISRSCGIVSNGRLVYRLTEGRCPNRNLWLVTFDDDNDANDEEVHETSFGKLVQSAKDASRKGEQDQTPPKAEINDQAESMMITTGGKTQSNRGQLKKGKAKKQQKQSGQSASMKMVKSTPKRQSPMAVSDSSYATISSERCPEAKVSAREERSLRRQAQINQAQRPKHTTSQHGKSGGKKRLTVGQPNLGGKTKKLKTRREEVVTIQLNTGILYLYRGEHRRAEFIRKV